MLVTKQPCLKREVIKRFALSHRRPIIAFQSRAHQKQVRDRHMESFGMGKGRDASLTESVLYRDLYPETRRGL